ncbi:MAG: 30S ribosomal protein S17 [Candidatus Bathyarchaeia archaeon]
MHSLKKPSNKCDDISCPFHGTLSVRGKILEGIVVRSRMQKSVVVRVDYLKFYPKYERYARKTSRITAHNPPCLSVREGDKVKIAECRPISKTKAFVVVEKEG